MRISLGSLSPWTKFQRCSLSHFFRILLVETFKMATMVNRRALLLANWVQFWKLGLISGKIEISEKTVKKKLLLQIFDTLYRPINRQELSAAFTFNNDKSSSRERKRIEAVRWWSQILFFWTLSHLCVHSQHSEATSELWTSPNHKLFRLWALVIAPGCNKSGAIFSYKESCSWLLQAINYYYYYK